MYIFYNTNQYFLLLYTNIYAADPFIVSYFCILHEKDKLFEENFFKKNEVLPKSLDNRQQVDKNRLQ